MRVLVWLLVGIIALFGGLMVGHFAGSWSLTPKLALDLEGGTEIILTPVTTNGQKVTSDDINQAIAIIRQRVDSAGVSEAEITSQGGSNIVVSLPGDPDQATIDLVEKSAHMEFRPVLAASAGVPTSDATGTTTDNSAPITAGPTADPTPTEPATATPSASASASADGSSTAESNPSDLSQITPEIQAQYDALDCTNSKNLQGGQTYDPDKPMVTCSQPPADGSAPSATNMIKYILGPVEIDGSDIASASSGPQVVNGNVTNNYAVNISFTSDGAKKFKDTTTRLNSLSAPQNEFAMVLDGLVISAPAVENGPITDGKAQITGSFTQAEASSLANQLNFGSLPLTFKVQSQEQISATLGSEQLSKGLLAGLIGLILVALYSLAQYRALGFVTIASLAVAGIITYGVLTFLSQVQGYRLSLPGIAGVIVSIGITADSFIVYFERVRDEIRDGRNLIAAVDQGWSRARRTILASDGVNLLAAVVLYFLAVGGVRGFAYTLGITTVVDVIIVFGFTHPMITLLARTEFFGGGHRWSGFDPVHLGAPEQLRYRGRGKIGPSTPAGAGKKSAPSPSTTLSGKPTGMTIAERRAAEHTAVAVKDRDVAEDDVSAEDSSAANESPGDPVDAGTDDDGKATDGKSENTKEES